MAHLGISKKTIYQFYADKDALVDAVLEIEMNNMQCDCATHKDACENAVHEIFLAMDTVEEMFYARMRARPIFSSRPDTNSTWWT